MSQVDTQQKPRTQSRQESPSVNGRQDGQKVRNNNVQKTQKGGENRTSKPQHKNDRGDQRREGSGRRTGNKDSKTIYVGKVFTDDLDGSNIAEQLKGQRLKYLREVLEQYGSIETFDAQIGDNFALVTYDNHKSAEDALRSLRNRDEVDSILQRIENKILTNKLPTAVVPDLHRYKYNWSEKQPTNRARSAGAKGGNAGPKNVVAKKSSEQAPSPTTQAPVQQQQQKQPQQPQQPQQQDAQKPKKTRKQKGEETEQTQPVQQLQAPQRKGKQNIQQQTNALSPKTQQGADDLQREAERARLTQDLHYLRQQQQHVSQELSAESDRCRARDERINRLSEELSRVRQQEQFLESQLKAEQNWKQAAEDRIIKLTEEVNHFVQEQKQVEKRLSTVSQQLNAATNGQ